jgi:hypothetical protein
MRSILLIVENLERKLLCRGNRPAKEKTSFKIDACVALSFAVLAAVQYGRPPSITDAPIRKIVVNTRFDCRNPDLYLKNYR